MHSLSAELGLGPHARWRSCGDPAGWTYYDTTPVCEPIRDFIAFDPDKVDAIEVA
jgi:uncharacterized protein (DUF427 family)